MRAGKWYAQPGRRYFTMASCPEDGEFYLRVRIVPTEDGQLRANRLVYEPSEELNAVYEKLASAPKRRRPRRRKHPRADRESAPAKHFFASMRYYRTAMHSISTSAPFGSAAICTQLRAGKPPWK